MPHPPQQRDTVRAIERLAGAFFAAVSFDADRPPRYEHLHDLFVARGFLVNNAGDEPQVLDVGAFARAREATWRTGEIASYRVSPISATTESFGRVAQHACTFVREGTQRDGRPFVSRGAIFFQCVEVAGEWRIASAAWDDQRPGQPLMTHPEASEFA